MSNSLEAARGTGRGIRPCPACATDSSVGTGELGGWTIALCPACRLRYTIDVPSDDQLLALYNQLYKPGDQYEMHLGELRRLQQSGKVSSGFYRSKVFLNRVRPKPGDRLLEVGCGVGTFLVAAHRRGWQVEGVDLSETAVAASREVHGLPVRQGTLNDLALEEGKFRAVACWEVFEHLSRPAELLGQVRRLMRTDGVLACSVPNESPRARAGRRGMGSLPPVHLNFWDEQSLRAFFVANGWRPIITVVQRSMVSAVNPRREPFRFAVRQAGALLGVYEGPHLYALVAAN